METWIEKENALHKTFKFDTFEQAILFMQACIDPIDALNHHPEWKNVYNRVEIKLTTHDAGNTVTDKDRQLASILDKTFQNFMA